MLDLSIYFIGGSQDFAEQYEQNRANALIAKLEEALKVGIQAFQFREKGTNSLENWDDKMALAKECQKLCKKYAAKFFINDSVEMALALKSDGLHIGQTDANIDFVLKKIPQEMLLGLSLNSLEDAKRALKLKGIDYFGVGSIFATTSKADANQATGTQLISAIKALKPKIPLIAIGGINQANVASVWNAGADGIAIISAITKSSNLEKTLSALVKNRPKKI